MRFQQIRWLRGCCAIVVMTGSALASGCSGAHPTALVGTWRTNMAYANMQPSPNIQSVVLDMTLVGDGTSSFELSTRFTTTATTSIAGCLEITRVTGLHWSTDVDNPPGSIFITGTPIYTVALEQCPDPAFNMVAAPSTRMDFNPSIPDGAPYTLTNGTLTISSPADAASASLQFAPAP